MTAFPKPSRYRWVVLSLIFLLALVSSILIFSYSILIPEVMSELRITHAQAGLVFSALVVAVMVSRIPWGVFCDLVGFKKAIGLGATVMSVFGFLRGLAPDYLALLALQLLFGIGYAALMPSAPKAISEWFSEDELGSATGVYVAGYSVGMVLALGTTSFASVLLGGWRGVFCAYGAMGLAFAAVWWILSKPPSSGKEVAKHSEAISYREVLKMGDAWLLTGIFMSAVGCQDTLSVWLPTILEAKGLGEASGLASSMLPLGFLISGLVVGAVSDKIRSRKLPILVLGSLVGPLVVATALASGLLIWALPLMLGFCTFGIMTMVFTIPGEHPEMRDRVGSVLGLAASVGNLASLTMPVVVGYIKDITGSFLPSMIALAVLGECSLLLGLKLRER